MIHGKQNLNFLFKIKCYRISSYSFRGKLFFSEFGNPKVIVHKCAETIEGRKLFKGGNYMRKYGKFFLVLLLWFFLYVKTRGLYTFYPLFEVQKRFFKGLFFLKFWPYICTVAINELLCLKNAGAQISMFFTSNE